MRRKIQIINHTHWSTRDLRRFVVQACNDIIPDGKKPFVRCTFVYRGTRSNESCSGEAFLNGHSMTIRLQTYGVDRVDLGHVLGHEIGHLLGYEHKDMRHSARWNRVAGWRKIYAWAEELPLNRKVEKPKAVKDNSLATQVAKLEIRLTKWETKAKRANNKIVSIKKEIAKMNKKIAKANASNHDALQALSPSEDLTKKFALLYRLTTNVCDALGNVVGYTGDEVKMQVEIPEGHKPMVQSENGTLMMVDWSEVEEA
jgi:hypothetical protein